jgi:hypothetical protein
MLTLKSARLGQQNGYEVFDEKRKPIGRRPALQMSPALEIGHE